MLLTILRLMAKLPLRFLHAVGAVLGWSVYVLAPTYRRRMHDHAAIAGIPWSVARGSVAHLGRMLMELPLLWCRPRNERLGARARWAGTDLITPALAKGKGLLILTPHLGAFEVAAQLYAETHGQTHPMTALYRPARKAWLRELVRTSRDRSGLDTAPANLQGVRQMLRALKAGNCVGLLPDQVPPESQGVWAPFFGRPAYTMTLAAKLAQQTGATIVLLRAQRLPRGRGYVVHQASLSENLPPATDTAQSAAVINRAMEHLIRQSPDQYLWSYNRYKEPRPQDTVDPPPQPPPRAS